MNRIFTTILAAALVASTLSSAQAGALGITTQGGLYSVYPTYEKYSQYQNDIYAYGDLRFRVASRDSLISMFDQKRGLRYRIDFNKTGEQDLSPKYVEFLRTNSQVQLLGSFVDRITVSDARSANVAKSDRVLINLNIYISKKTAAGILKAKLQVPCSIESAIKPIRSYNMINFQEKKEDRQVVVAKTLGKMTVVDFELGTDRNANTAGREVLQLITDMFGSFGIFGFGAILIPAVGVK